MGFTAAVTHEDSWFVARCLEVAVTSWGETVEEALANLKEALELNGVTSTSARGCTAVGESADNANENPSSTLDGEWNGTSWQLVSLPNPAGSSSTLNGVSCTTPTTCIAVGASYATSAGASLVETSSG